MRDIDKNSLEEELEKCEHFLVNKGMENGRHRVQISAMDTLQLNYLMEKMYAVFNSLKCAAKLNVAFGFLPKNVQVGSCRFYYAHKNITLLERSRVLATSEDLTKFKNLISNTDVIESRKRERANKKWKIYKLMIVTILAAILKEIPTGCNR